ncbi:hypothetical protein BMS3Abin16_01026 [archaeon BMS3Abin16]|nr:hypothetical protein BMS3Abin16_01026 [archaeon BMS3Abin16]GBE56859.1 hypothetical protein BMS3Bbin16_01072 [archaeon BMS3Bbin16]
MPYTIYSTIDGAVKDRDGVKMELKNQELHSMVDEFFTKSYDEFFFKCIVNFIYQ